MNQGFTLIELLVVVLIIGILAAIALPQYEAVIEKSRMTEAMVNMKAIADAVQRFDQANPGEAVYSFSNIADVDLKGGSKTSSRTFQTNLFTYTLENKKMDTGKVTAVRKDGDDTLYTLTLSYDGATRGCTAEESDFSALCTFFTNM